VLLNYWKSINFLKRYASTYFLTILKLYDSGFDENLIGDLLAFQSIRQEELGYIGLAVFLPSIQ
jgi:hypothetical protein